MNTNVSDQQVAMDSHAGATLIISGPWRYLVMLAFFVIFVSSSFDLALNLVVAGYSFRLFYGVVLLLALPLLVQLCRGRPVRMQLVGMNYFILWFFVLTLFVANTSLLGRNLGYLLWLILSYTIVATMSYYVREGVNFRKLFYLYLLSFNVLAIFGLIQFALALVGVDFFVAQWWILGKLPRINGLSYEPSYYATYMIIGWSLYLFLYLQGVRRIYHINTMCWLAVITFALVLCSSRMGILIMVLTAAIVLAAQSLRGLSTHRVEKRYFWLLLLFLLVIFSAVALAVAYWEYVSFLLSGTGLFGESGHSVSIRSEAMTDLFKIFYNHPIIGYSLGGVPYARAELNDVILLSQAHAKEYEGINIFAELLVAGGIIGFSCFIAFIIALIRRPIALGTRLIGLHRIDVHITFALVGALIIELVILSFNQTILRPYLWVLLGFVNVTPMVMLQSDQIRVPDRRSVLSSGHGDVQA